LIDKDNGILAVKGAIPGHKNGYLVIREARKIPKVAQKGSSSGIKADNKDESKKK